MNLADHVAAEAEKREQERRRKEDHVRQLSQQREAQEQSRAEHKKLWREWKKEVDDDALRFKQEQAQRRASELEARVRFNEDRRRQLEEAHRVHQAQREADEREGRRMLLAAQEAKKLAEENQAEKKARDRKAAQFMLDEVKKSRSLKAQVKREDALNDKRLIQAQAE